MITCKLQHRRQFSIAWVLVILLIPSACVKTIQIESQPTIASYKEAFPTSRVAGKTVIIVRTNTGYQKEQQEVAGAKCTMESEEIYASFVSPAKITVPTFSQRSKFANRGRPSPLRVECHIDGKFGVNSLTANDKEVSVATNAGIAGAVVSLLVSGAIASATPWRYAQLNYVHIDNVAQLDGETKLDGEAKAE